MTQLLETEIRSYLSQSKRVATSRNVARDVHIVLHYYGFGDTEWPTLQQIGDNFGGISRQRVRQLVQRCFKGLYKGVFKGPKQAASVLEKHAMIRASEFSGLLADEGLVQQGQSCKGVLNLIQDCGYCNQYSIVTPRLRDATRRDLDLYEDQIIIKNSTLKAMKKHLHQLRAAPGLSGLANLIECCTMRGIDNHLTDHYKELFLLSDDIVCIEDEDNFWYAVESRENRIVNLLERVFAVCEMVDENELISTIVDSLKSRTIKYSYPPISVLERYLDITAHLEHREGRYVYNGTPAELTDTDLALFVYLDGKHGVSFPEIRDYLKGTVGMSDAGCIKTVAASPIVAIDKSEGRGHYRYYLIGSEVPLEQVTPQLRPQPDVEDRYQEYCNRLREMAGERGTDVDRKIRQRREQDILQGWLFEGKKTDACGICGEQFPVSMLVTAHKKKRAKCTDEERLDPYVVMPMCKLGCDSLYEAGYINVADGQVITHSVDGCNIINAYLERVDGRRLDDAWLAGSEAYFK